MNAKELYELEDFGDFIAEFEDKWLQYADETTKVKAFFSNAENGLALFEKWKNGYELFGEEQSKAFSNLYKFE